MPFFAELVRKGLLDTFLHYSLKDSPKNYLENSHWLLEHDAEKQRLLKTLDEINLFGDVQ